MAPFLGSSIVLLFGQTPQTANSEVFSRIHKSELIHMEMEYGKFEFRIYRNYTEKNIGFFLLEYVSESGKRVVFKCNNEFDKIVKIKKIRHNSNYLSMEYEKLKFLYTGSFTALYHEEPPVAP